jgi:hypothetical protein
MGDTDTVRSRFTAGSPLLIPQNVKFMMHINTDIKINMKRIIISITLSIAMINVYSQSPFFKEINGKVLDKKGHAMIGADVFLAGTNFRALTNIYGEFELNVPNDDIYLKIRFIDITIFQMVAKEQNSIEIKATKDIIKSSSLIPENTVAYSQYKLDSLLKLQKQFFARVEFQECKKEYTIEKYESFIKRYSNSELVDSASYYIKELSIVAERSAFNELMKNPSLINCLSFEKKFPETVHKEEIIALKNKLNIIHASSYDTEFSYEELGFKSPSNFKKLNCQFLVSMTGGHIGPSLIFVPISAIVVNSNVSGGNAYSTYRDDKNLNETNSYIIDNPNLENKDKVLITSIDQTMYKIVSLGGSKFYACDFTIVIPVGTFIILPNDEVFDFGKFEAYDGYVELQENIMKFSDNTKIHIK